jgi:hypothetical protein
MRFEDGSGRPFLFVPALHSAVWLWEFGLVILVAASLQAKLNGKSF